MARRFSVATDPLTPDEVKALKDALKVGAWWHWLPNYWLILDRSDRLTADAITTIINEINPRVRALVLEVEDINWSALTKKDGKGRDMADWLRNTWPLD